MYDFETLVDRRKMNSNKWANMRLINPETPEGVVPFSIADMEFKNAPEITDGLREFLEDAILGYARTDEEFLSSICRWMIQRHQWNVKEEWIAVSIGVVPALTNAILAFTEPGDGVIVMPPVYFPFYESILRNDRRVVKNSLVQERDRYEIDFRDLERKAKDRHNKLLLLCSPHNPVGRVWTEDELREVSRICLKYDVLVVSDEIHFDLIMPGHRHTVFAALSDEAADRCITCTSPSKTFNLAGMQASAVLISNKSLRKRFVAQMEQSGHFGLSILAYQACRLAYEKGEAWLDELIPVLADNAEFVKNYMETWLPKIRVFPLEGTYLQWWDCRDLGLNYMDLSHLMTHEAFIFMDEGYQFGDEGQGFERMNLACPRFVLQDALDRLRCALKPHI